MSITQKIRKQLEQSNGLTQERLEPLAVEYASAIAKVNERLAECVGLIRKGLRSEGLQRAKMAPNLLDIAAELEFPELAEWVDILRFYGIEVPDNLDVDAVRQLNDAFLEEQPLEELLKQHRRLAIAKAPLGWRLKLLRHIADVDSMNTVWLDDIQAWETIRLSQIASEFTTLSPTPESKKELTELQEELGYARWSVKPPAALVEKVNRLAGQLAYSSQLSDLRGIAEALHNAFAAGDEVQAEELCEQWNRGLKLVKGPPPRELLEDVAPALEWVAQCREEHGKLEMLDVRSAALREILKKPGATEHELVSSYQDILGLQVGIDPLLEQRYESRLMEIQQQGKRKQILALTAIVAATLAIAGGLGGWLWNRSYASSVQVASERLGELIQRQEYAQAETVYRSLEEQSNDVVKAPEIIALKAALDKEAAQEQKRAEMVAKLISAADSADEETLSLEKIVAAENVAKTPDEVSAIKEVRARFDAYERRLVDGDMQRLRLELNEFESKLEGFKKSPLGSVVDAEIDGVVFDIKALLTKYPKAATQGTGLVDLAFQRATSLRDSFRKQKREMEQKQQGLSGIRTATSIDNYIKQLRKYVDGLPNDAMAMEMKESLKESSLWETVEEWNSWCNELALKGNAKLDPGVASDLMKRQKGARDVIGNLPGEAYLELFQSRFSGFERRGELLDALIEELNDSIIVELKTVKDASNKRVFVHEEDVTDIVKKISRNGPTATTTLQVISDATGSVSNRDFRGKLSIDDEPRQYVTFLIQEIESNKKSTSAAWDAQLLTYLDMTLARPGVDSSIKEMLFSRLLLTASEGSSTLQTAFAQVQSDLNNSSERRKRWFEEAEANEKPRESLQQGFQEAKMKMDIVRREEEEAVTNLAKSKLVWVGGLLRDGSSNIAPFLYREKIPDGTLWVVVPTGTNQLSGKLVKVGNVSGDRAQLVSVSDELQAGRPLFWMRESSN